MNGIIICIMGIGGLIGIIWCFGGILVRIAEMVSTRHAANGPAQDEKQLCEQCGLSVPVRDICGVGRAGHTTYHVCRGCLGNLKRSRQNA